MKQYDFLFKEPGPRMITEALKLIGTKEIEGPVHSRVILGWVKELGLSGLVRDDETAWCGIAHAYVAMKAGKDVPMKGYDVLRALKWAEFGTPVQIAKLGDTLVFKRAGGGHVGCYVGEDSTAYHVLGGNQSNQYGFTRILKTRIYAIRRPFYKVQPDNVRRIFVHSSGVLSTNEE